MDSSNRQRFLEAFGGPPRVILVAEIGNNHEGDFGLAREMVAAAAECGADAVKFQHFVPSRYVAISEDSRRARLQQFALNNDQLLELFDLSRSLGLVPFATAFDVETQDWLSQHQKILKIASADNTFSDLIQSAGLSSLPTIVSTGFLSSHEILDLEKDWRNKFDTPFALLHCVAAYPAAHDDLNLLSIPHLSRAIPRTPVGFSDHSIGITAALTAVALGAFLIEKHFTIDHNHSDFRDHQLSANPAELTELAKGIRLIERSMGNGVKEVTSSELAHQELVRRSAAAKYALPAGTKILKADIIYLRPGNGFPPSREAELLGRLLIRNIKEGETITESDVRQP